jgi:hypothetical protein
MGWFEYVFNTPSHHRVHHGRNPKYIDKNHAGSLIIWDKMFGTFKAEEDTPVYGVTRVTEHWDPVSAHIKPIVEMVKDMLSVKGLKNKIAIAIMPPGWYPSELGGRKFPPEVEKGSYRKFNVVVATKLQVYLFIHFLSVLGGTAYFLFTYTANSIQENAYWALGLTISIISLGLLFESRKIAWFIEISRLIALLIICQIVPNEWLKYFIMIYLIASLFLIFKYRNLLTR